MEALVVALAALTAAVLIDAGYWVAISLMRWSPALIIGAAVSWFAHREGLGSTEALAAGALASIALRQILRRKSEAREWND
ncbi:MAG: hypothetical protein JNJ73_13515 [Hyphomonadaceae bacterium]|nr:hypothetical protein [Hyphomonadaceae bacterium]